MKHFKTREEAERFQRTIKRESNPLTSTFHTILTNFEKFNLIKDNNRTRHYRLRLFRERLPDEDPTCFQVQEFLQTRFTEVSVSTVHHEPEDVIEFIQRATTATIHGTMLETPHHFIQIATIIRGSALTSATALQ